MPATTNVNFRTVVHEKSSGVAMFFPDVCKTPAPPAPPIPIPYPNIAMSSDTDKGSSKVKIDGCPVMLDGSNFKTSTGDEAGTAGGGVVSSKTKGKAEFVNFSFDVKIEGKGVPRLGDMMLGNKGGSPNTPPMPEVQGPLIMVPPMDQSENEEVELDALEESDPEGESSQDDAGGGRSLDTGAATAKPAGKAGNEKEAEAKPTLKAKWGKKEIHPLHNKNETPSSAPTDDIPEECKVKLEADTTEVPDGTAASIEIRHAHTGALVKNGTFNGLVVKGNKVVDPKTNAPLEWTVDAEARLWDPWDKPFYFFKVYVEHGSLAAETPKDCVGKAAECLRLLYWSACVSDKMADDHPTRPLTTQVEMADIAAILEGNPNHKVLKRAFKTADQGKAAKFRPLWGSVIRNSYVYHHGSHGAVMCAVDGEYFLKDSEKVPTRCPMPDGENHPGESVALLLEGLFLRAEWVENKIEVPSVPRYLAYFNTCQTGWEGGLCNAFVKRGTRNAIAFRKSIGDAACVNLAKNFYGTWMNTHSGDPGKIPTVFFDVGASCYTSLRPVLYGKGGGAISDPDALSALEIAAVAIGAIAGGILIGVAVAGLVKSL